ncbi:MAG: zinc-ribbon domain-containing protein, partial [Desulfobacterales bacterium]|nr:zinc-ribbon domain-containing protein [Desulfobacterales bacterium]
MMDIICDACGKKYRVDETKMKGESAKVKCKVCNHIMVITKPKPVPPRRPSGPQEIPEPEVSREPPMPERFVERPISPPQEAEELAGETPPFYSGQ